MTTTTGTYKIAVIGAGGKMGMRVSNNLAGTRTRRSTSRTPPRAASARSRRVVN